jgi:SCY1-like protein 2
VFVFDKKSLDSHGASLGRSSASSLKRATEEVVERLKKEASSLVRTLSLYLEERNYSAT